MRAYSISTAVAVATAALPLAGTAMATDITIGSSLASACYDASMASITPRFGLIECNRAIEEELLTAEDRASTFVNRGILRMKARDDRGADQDFDMALGIHDGNAEALLNKGFLRLRQGRYQAALPFLDRSIRAGTVRPALAHYARAIVHEELGDVRAAYADLVKARAADPAWSVPAQELARFKVGER